MQYVQSEMRYRFLGEVSRGETPNGGALIKFRHWRNNITKIQPLSINCIITLSEIQTYFENSGKKYHMWLPDTSQNCAYSYLIGPFCKISFDGWCCELFMSIKCSLPEDLSLEGIKYLHCGNKKCCSCERLLAFVYNYQTISFLISNALNDDNNFIQGTGSHGMYPAHGKGVGIRWSLRSLSTPIIQWFCEFHILSKAQLSIFWNCFL